jgi:hypothetical protein
VAEAKKVNGVFGLVNDGFMVVLLMLEISFRIICAL